MFTLVLALMTTLVIIDASAFFTAKSTVCIISMFYAHWHRCGHHVISTINLHFVDVCVNVHVRPYVCPCETEYLLRNLRI